MRPVPALVLGLVTLLLAAPSLVAAQTASPVAPGLAAAGDFAGLVDIGSRSLYMECRGQAAPRSFWKRGFGRVPITGPMI